MSSLSSQHAMNFWPRPMVYLPLDTLSKTSSSSSEIHCTYERGLSADARMPCRVPAHPAREVHLHGEDTDVLGTWLGLEVVGDGDSHGWWWVDEDVVVEGGREETGTEE